MLIFATVLLLTLMLGVLQIARSRNALEALLTAQLLGTTTTAILLLLAQGLALPALFDVALLFSLLGALLSMAFVRLRIDDRINAHEENDS